MKIGPNGDSPLSGTSGPGNTGSTARATPAETGKAQGSPAAQVITGEASATVALSSSTPAQGPSPFVSSERES